LRVEGAIEGGLQLPIPQFVIAALVAAMRDCYHVSENQLGKALSLEAKYAPHWIAGTSPAMTESV
jgi:hypothetical protein